MPAEQKDFQPLYSSDAYTEKLKIWVPVRGLTKPGGRPDPTITGWLQGTVKKVVNKVNDQESLLLVATEDGQEQEISSRDCPLQNERDDQLDDLVRSDFLHEPGILHTLKVRYQLDSVYTYSGTILIAANPMKNLKNMYGPRMMVQYRDQQLGELSPHVYAIAEQAFSSMMIDQAKQAILISGESGAGKTESAKKVMQYLAQRSTPAATFMTQALKRTLSRIPIEEQVLESNPLLEAFGNAKTSRNENSSRFGKFTEIFFDRQGKVLGAQVRVYLLERSRVVKIATPERTYHIFYQMLAGCDDEQKERYKLTHGLGYFDLITQSDMLTLSKVTDDAEFGHTLEAMRTVGIKADDQDAILKITSAVLHLNNVKFVGKDDSEFASDKAKASLQDAAELLGVEYDTFLAALTTKEVKVVNEMIQRPLSGKEATDNTEALLKTIYSRLFDWLVASVNANIMVDGAARHSHRVIGILDIYGFEHFKVNSFEQLCINLANERLQQQFNGYVFKGEQQTYQREGISWEHVAFKDNQDVLDLLEGGAKLPGVFPLIDEASRIANADAEGLARELKAKHEPSPVFGAVNRPPNSFAVQHFAGSVIYAADSLIEKNKDYVVDSHQRLMESSTIELLNALFPPPPKEEPPPEAKPVRGRRKPQQAIKFNSVGAAFRLQLAGLMDTLNSCQPHYIRCIKPNPKGTPGVLDGQYSLEQLRAGGVLEAVRIAVAGFPSRRDCVPFTARYVMLMPPDDQSRWEATTANGEEEADLEVAKDIARKLLEQEQLEGAQVGKTKVFLRAGQLAKLEASRTRRMAAAATIVQTAFRMHRELVRFRRQKAAAQRIQANWFARRLRRQFLEYRDNKAATIIQKYWRRHAAIKELKHRREEHAAIVIQKNVRMIQQRKRFLIETELGRKMKEKKEREQAAGVLQKYARRWFVRQKERKERERRELVRNLETQVASLQHDVAFWQTRCEDGDAAQAELRANVRTLKNELELVKAQAQEEAQAEIESAERRAHESALAEIRVIKGQKEEMEARLEETRGELDTSQRQLTERDEQNRALRDQMEELKRNFLKLKQDAIEREERHNAALEAKGREVDAAKEELRQARLKQAVQLAAHKEQIKELQRKPAVDGEIVQRLELGAKARQDAELLAVTLASVKQDNRDLVSRLTDREEHVKLLETKLTELNVDLADLSKDVMLATGRLEDGESAALIRKVSMRETEPAAGSGAGEGYFANHEPVEILLAGITATKLAKLPLPTSRLPFASWIVSRALFEWCRVWSEDELYAVMERTQTVLAGAMERDFSLSGRTYWFQTMLGMCGMLNSFASTLNSHILRDMATALLGFNPLQDHYKEILLDQVKLNPAELLSAKWGKLLRHKGRADRQAAMSEEMPGRHAPWERLTGSLTNLVSSLKREGLPAPAVKAITLALLGYIDGQVLNSLMLRRDCCSTSSVKALQKGIQELRKWAIFMGVAWCGTQEQVEHQLRHLMQAVRYMLQGKDELTRVVKHADIMPQLKRYTRDLTLAQLYKLTEHHYDDWTATSISPGKEVLGLLERLKALDSGHGGLSRQGSRQMLTAPSVGGTAPTRGPDVDELLVDMETTFVFDKALLYQAVRAYFDGDTKQAMATLQVQLQRQDLPQAIADCPELAFLQQQVKHAHHGHHGQHASR